MNVIKRKLNSGSSRSVAVKKNMLGSLGVKVFSILVSLLLVPMTLGYVSSELYGIWLTLSSITLWLNFFDIGFTLGLKNKLAEALAHNDYVTGKALVSTTYFMMIVIFVPLFFVLFPFIPLVDWAKFLNVSMKYNNQIIQVLYVLLGCFCFQMITNILTVVIAAFQKVALSSLFGVIGNCISLLIIFFLTKYAPPSLLGLAMAVAVAPILVIVVASLVLYNRRFKKIAPSISSVNKYYIKELFSLGFTFFLIQIQVVVLYQSTNILISNVSSSEDVAAYNIAYKYLGIAMMVYTIMLQPIWPAFTDAFAKKDYVWMKSVYRKMTSVWMLSAIASVIMVLISPLVYHLWIGDKVVIPFSMTILIAVYMILHSLDSLQVNIINGIGTIKLQSFVTLIGLILHIPLSLFLGQYMGAIGVICSMIIINVIYLSFFSTQLHKIINQTATGIWAK